MPSHELHRKWAEEYGFDGEIANEIDRIIDDRRHHDAVKVMVTNMIAMEAVAMLMNGDSPEEAKSALVGMSWMFPKKVREYAEILFTEYDTTGMKVIKRIYDEYGPDGLRIAVLHVALDYIEQLYLRGYKDWEIRDRIRYGKKERLYYLLKSAGLNDFIDKNLEKILRDIKDSKSPSKVMKEGQEKYRKILNMLKEQDISAIVINGTPYPPSTGIRKLQSILKRGGWATVGLVSREHVFREKKTSSLHMPTGIFYNDYYENMTLMQLLETFRPEYGWDMAVKYNRGGTKTFYFYQDKRIIKSLEELFDL
ncbi:hypothetical protein [Thermococcus sp.]